MAARSASRRIGTRESSGPASKPVCRRRSAYQSKFAPARTAAWTTAADSSALNAWRSSSSSVSCAVTCLLSVSGRRLAPGLSIVAGAAAAAGVDRARPWLDRARPMRRFRPNFPNGVLRRQLGRRAGARLHWPFHDAVRIGNGRYRRRACRGSPGSHARGGLPLARPRRAPRLELARRAVDRGRLSLLPGNRLRQPVHPAGRRDWAKPDPDSRVRRRGPVRLLREPADRA